jgi:phage repressor protein C with HTH and peptisase S24 domain
MNKIHISMQRVYEAASKLKGIEGQTNLATLLNESPQTINNWEARGISKNGLLKVQELVGCNAQWVQTGGGSMELSFADSLLMGYKSNNSTNKEDAINLPLLNSVASMGSGSDTTDHEVVIDMLSVSRTWVNKTLNQITNTSNLAFIHAIGDSMTPTFNDGDILLVDTGVQSVDTDSIYVLDAHERLFIKRVRRRLDGTFEISSDNPAVKTVDILNGGNQVSIKGKVLWAWNGRRL